MIVQIEPTTIAKTASTLEITIPDFKLGGIEGLSRVIFMTSEGAAVDIKYVPIPADIYAQWGTDDNYIVVYVLEQLNLIAAGE